MNAAELFVKCLEAEGVKVVFGLPGEENADFAMALQDSSMQFVLTRHEQGAAFMADVWGRLTGEAGVCFGTLGPGATNLVTGVADGNLDRAPMMVITGQADLQRLHKESHQNMDVVGMFQPLTKGSASVLHADTIPEMVRKAFKLATMEKPGACHVELPEDVAGHAVTSEPIAPSVVRRPAPEAKSLARAEELLRKARRPIILAGNGAIRRRASRELRRFCEVTGIGAVSTFMGKGSVGRDDPHCLFTIGLQSKDVVACAVDAADLVITVGYDLVEYHPQFWNPNADSRIIHIDFLPAEVDAHYPVAAEVVGDIAYALEDLTHRLKHDTPAFDLKQQGAVRREMLEEFALHKDDDTEGSIRPQKVLWDVREALGPKDIVLSDVGAHKMWIARHYQCDEPNTCLISNGFCSMGFALPGAIGAKLVHPDRNVLAICGDGGFLMNSQEMETARRIGTKVVVMIWEDGGYGLISWKQENHFGRSTQLSFGNPDFLKLAEAFDWSAWRVENARDLAPTLRKALDDPRPSLLIVPIDYRENRLLTERLGQISCPI